ncbi:MAG: hypothetical protein LBM27_05840 [Lactobacillaceae bacterium]|jgi:apolipoprotein N-acyltransferase|nr:hypothetical protein [Lactobacillaceae bacterium]
MKKSVWAVLSAVIVVFVVAALFLWPKQNYAVIALNAESYKKVTTVKNNVDATLKVLATYNKNMTDTNYQKVKKQVSVLITENGKNLTSDEFNKLKAAADQKDGVLKVVTDSFNGKYQINDEISSLLQPKFQMIIYSSTSSITESEKQNKKIATQIEKDLSVDSKLYQIGNIN